MLLKSQVRPSGWGWGWLDSEFVQEEDKFGLGPGTKQVGLRVRQESPATKEANVTTAFPTADCQVLGFVQGVERRQEGEVLSLMGSRGWGAEGKGSACPLGSLKAKRFLLSLSL